LAGVNLPWIRLRVHGPGAGCAVPIDGV
jgi:hypothetical protein